MGTTDGSRGTHRLKRGAVLGTEGLKKGVREHREPTPRSASALRVRWAAFAHTGSEERLLNKRACFLLPPGWHGRACALANRENCSGSHLDHTSSSRTGATGEKRK